MGPVATGFIASFLAGAATAVGALPILFGRTVSRKWNDTLLGFAAGVMLAASFFSLILPGLEYAGQIYGGDLVPALIAVIGVVAGVAFVAALDAFTPHEHFAIGRQGPEVEAIARIWLFVLAITIHNLPEGLAVGVEFGGGDFTAGMTLATGIGLQNAPEGLAVAVALSSLGYGRLYAFAIAGLTGAVEPVTELLGAYAVSLSSQMLPWELTFGLTVGLVVMMFLDVYFG